MSIALCLAFLLGAAMGCVNHDATLGVPRVTVPPGSPISLMNDIQPIFTSQCALAFCHGSPPGFPMSLEDGNSHAALVGVQSLESPLLRVKAGDSGTSFLIHKLEGTLTSGESGVQMPLGGPYLPEPEIQLIRDWIDQGALDN
jgi:hypothetical protein